MKKLYVIVRNDLSKSQQAVQGGHAVAQYLIENRDTDWPNGTLVYLKVANEGQLRNCFDLLESEYGCSPVAFYEPWWDNEMTALATTSHAFNDLLDCLDLL